MDCNRDEIFHRKCQVCDGAISVAFRKRTKFGVFDIFRCEACRFAFVNPTPSFDSIERHYSSLGFETDSQLSTAVSSIDERNDTNAIKDAKTFSLELASMTEGRSLLDVGCGYGFFSLAAIQHGFSVDALEIANAKIPIAKEVLGFSPIQETFEGFQPTRKYDAIIMSQVLEHAREPTMWLQKARELLNPAGVIAIAVPNFGSIFSDILRGRDPFVIPPTHLNYFNPKNIARLADRNGFDAIKIRTFTPFRDVAFTRRFGRHLGPSLNSLSSNVVMPVFDIWQKGYILNIYVRKR